MQWQSSNWQVHHHKPYIVNGGFYTLLVDQILYGSYGGA